MPTINEFKKEIAHIFLSFKCNIKCDYCINRFNENNAPFCKLNMNHKKIRWEQWVEALQQFPKETVFIFQGGEPTLYTDFHKIINNIDNNLKIFSNLHEYRSIEELANIVRKDNILICTTLHAATSSVYNVDNVFIHINMLNSIGCNLQVEIIDTPDLTDKHREILQKMPNILKPLIGYCKGILYGPENMMNQIEALSGKPKNVICWAGEEGLIAPDGNIYKCTYGMYTGDKNLVIGNVFEGIYNEQEHIFCRNYGYCNPCDFCRKIKIEKS